MYLVKPTILVPALRFNRALTACYLYPEHPIQAIAISETISVFGPFFNENLYAKIIGIMYSMIYNPLYAYFYLDWYIKTEKKHYQTELFLLLLLNIFYIV